MSIGWAIWLSIIGFYMAMLSIANTIVSHKYPHNIEMRKYTMGKIYVYTILIPIIIVGLLITLYGVVGVTDDILQRIGIS